MRRFERELTTFEIKPKPIVRYHVFAHFGDEKTENTIDGEHKDSAIQTARMLAGRGATEVSVERVTIRADKEEIDWRDGGQR